MPGPDPKLPPIPRTAGARAPAAAPRYRTAASRRRVLGPVVPPRQGYPETPAPAGYAATPAPAGYESPAAPSEERNWFSSKVLPQIVNMGPFVRYMQDNRSRLYKLEKRFEISEFNSEFHAKNTVDILIPAESGTGQPSNFTTAMVPDTWRMINSFKYDNSFYMSDVIALAYKRSAMKHGFFGELPGTIVRCNICNKETLAVINETEEKVAKGTMTAEQQLILFMEKTDNGKSTKRLLDVFGLEVYSMQWDGENAILDARKKSQ
ncbi:hypothetical protein [Enterobacter roggenkampii]|uniref:hypothetical protein n=1 Tax=Enterobacter roggenkampii TaxID=1812935 RepID=UPI002A83D83E|nr:hypothetical protein [Enterobacter roggenkampii]